MARQRTRAQVTAFAAIAMVAMVGGVALVVDMGVFFVIQRQMQAAADTAALAAVWYEPLCNPITQGSGGCQPSAGHVISPECSTAPEAVACTVALDYARQNLGAAAGLCGGPDDTSNLQIHPYSGGALLNPSVNIYVVAIHCDARYWFGRILPSLPLSKSIGANSAATIGWRGTNGDVASSPPPLPNPVLIARLIRI